MSVLKLNSRVIFPFVCENRMITKPAYDRGQSLGERKQGGLKFGEMEQSHGVVRKKVKKMLEEEEQQHGEQLYPQFLPRFWQNIC